MLREKRKEEKEKRKREEGVREIRTS